MSSLGVNAGASRRASLAMVLVVVGITASCNQILGNHDGANAPGADAALDAPVDSSQLDANGETGASCREGTKRCVSGCVANDDALNGCGAQACAPCVVPHASARCGGDGTCVVDACKVGYDDCDAAQETPQPGCETDLSQPLTCGRCNAQCTAGRVCGLEADEFKCLDTCPAGTLNCGDNRCSDTKTDVLHCGGCETPCDPAPANGSVSCVGGKCVPACEPGYQACGGRCIPANAVPCGTSCEVCGDQNTKDSACKGGVCALTCMPEYVDSDSDPSNGCECFNGGIIPCPGQGGSTQ